MAKATAPQPDVIPHETPASSSGQPEVEYGPSIIEEDALMTPRIRDWPSTHTSEGFSLSKDTAQSHQAPAPFTSEAEAGDYFPPVPVSSNETDFPREPSIPTDIVRPATSHDPERPRTSSLTPLGEPETTSMDTTGEVAASLYNPGNTRPTSVPNLQSSSLSRRRDGPDYPQYPNQSFAALQKHPAHPHPLRTRGSNPLHELSYTSSNVSSSNNLPHVSPGSRTVGSTPAQSPSLFSPTYGKKPASESEDAGYSTPLLHPTHLQAPKEYVPNNLVIRAYANSSGHTR